MTKVAQSAFPQNANSTLSESQMEKIDEYVRDNLMVQGAMITPKKLEQKGFIGNANTPAIDEYVQALGADIYQANGVGDYIQQAHASTNYFPVDFDPQIYDQGVLYGYTPYTTFMEAAGRRAPTGYKTVQYIKITAGFAGEFHTETGTTSGSGEPTTSTATTAVKYMSVPISLSDVIGKGESRSARVQLLNYALQAFRETMNNALVIGDASGTESVDGILEIAKDNGYRPNQSNTEMTIKKIRDYDTHLRNSLKEPLGAILTNDYVVDQVTEDLALSKRELGQYNLTADINIESYNSGGRAIPIIRDPNVTLTAANRRMLLFNPANVMIEDFMSPTMITKGKSVPLATDYWLTGIVAQYCVKPTKMVDIYGIA